MARSGPCARGYFCRPAAEAVWGISDPKATFGVRATLAANPLIALGQRHLGLNPAPKNHPPIHALRSRYQWYA